MERNISKIRREDERQEKEVSKFLDKYFYKCVNEFKRYDKETNDDLHNQLKGIDTIFKYNGYLYKCDEKSAVHYVNKNLNTFALEISFISRDGRHAQGWLISDEKETNSYIFVWIDKSDTDNIESFEDIHELEMVLIKKEKIIEYFKNKGWGYKQIELKENKIRNNPNEYRGDCSKDGFCFFYSDKLSEKPINCIVLRNVLRELSDVNIKWRV